MIAPAAAAGAAAAAPAPARPFRHDALLALARVEAGRLLRHPALLAGLAAGVAVAAPRPSGEEGWIVPLVGWVLAAMGALVAAVSIAGRGRLLSSPDLFPATVVGPRDRALAVGLALAAPTLAGAAAVAVVAVRHAGERFPVGAEPYAGTFSPGFAHWAQCVLVIALAGVIGLAVAQFRRGRLAALVGLMFFIFVGGGGIWMAQAHPLRVLHPYLYPSYERELPATYDPATWSPGDPGLNPPVEPVTRWREFRFDTTALGWHLVYLVGLILVGVWWAARAAGRAERRPPPRWLLAAGLPLVAAGGVAQLVTAGVNP